MNKPKSPLSAQAQVLGDILCEFDSGIRRQFRQIIKAKGLDFIKARLRQTIEIQQAGGMLVKNSSRKRTPGGVFLQLCYIHWLDDVEDIDALLDTIDEAAPRRTQIRQIHLVFGQNRSWHSKQIERGLRRDGIGNMKAWLRETIEIQQAGGMLNDSGERYSPTHVFIELWRKYRRPVEDVSTEKIGDNP